jgi:hypothetical protein
MAKSPDVFVWTKIGDDAGEHIGGILHRKEAERVAGSFWWGIGTTLDRPKLQQVLATSGGELLVVLSKQLSPPKRSDSGEMALWTRWIDRWGKQHDIPDHAMVIGKRGAKCYYALVCRSDEPLYLRDQPFNDKELWNYPDGEHPGNSQNTALLTGDLQAARRCGRYKKGFLATLVEPWLVTLAGRRELTADERNLIANWDGKDYAALVRRIRR